MRLKVASFTVPVGHSCRDTEIANSVDSLQSSSLHIVQITKQERKGYECRATSANGSIIYSRPRQKETRKYEDGNKKRCANQGRRLGGRYSKEGEYLSSAVANKNGQSDEAREREKRATALIYNCSGAMMLLLPLLLFVGPILGSQLSRAQHTHTYIHKLYKQSGRATSGS